MIEVPPPIRISTPFTRLPSISRSFGMKPTSWIPVIARSASDAANAVFTFRGISWVVGWRTKYRE
jgi:hypothetical protein